MEPRLADLLGRVVRLRSCGASAGQVRYRHHALLNCPAARSLDSLSLAQATLRRSCATGMIRAGANPAHVKDLLGHPSPRSG